MLCFQASHDGYVYHIGICGELSQPGCEHSSLCRRRPGSTADVQKYTFNKMLVESGHMKLVYDLASPPSSCGNNWFLAQLAELFI